MATVTFVEEAGQRIAIGGHQSESVIERFVVTLMMPRHGLLKLFDNVAVDAGANIGGRSL